MNGETVEPGLTQGFRWAARILGMFASIFFLMFAIGEGIPDVIAGTPELIPLIMMVFVLAIGALVAWKDEFVGGAILTGGSLILGGYVYALAGPGNVWVALIYALPFLLPGLFFLACWRRSAYAED